jgi:cell division protease FtsH
MVCDWGMSDMGPLAFGDNQDHIFLGREIAREQNYSEQTAQTIDATVAKIIRSQYDRAVEILTGKQGCLESLAQALLQYETLEGKYVYEILEHGVLISEVAVPQAAKVESIPDISIVPALKPEGAV